MDIKLTEKEFDTIIEALEHLPNKNQDGKLFQKLMVGLICKGNEEAKQKAQEELAVQEQKEEADRRTAKKQCGIITGKLYMMKDQLVEMQ